MLFPAVTNCAVPIFVGYVPGLRATGRTLVSRRDAPASRTKPLARRDARPAAHPLGLASQGHSGEGLVVLSRLDPPARGLPSLLLEGFPARAGGAFRLLWFKNTVQFFKNPERCGSEEGSGLPCPFAGSWEPSRSCSS